jgi:hypothetical protein
MIPRDGFFATAIFLLVAGRAWATSNVWTPIGPPGGMVTGLAFDSSVTNQAYATTNGGGFFRSTDGGSSWNASNGGLRDAHLQSLATIGAAVYVGGADGVSRSDDRGLHFRRLPHAPILVTALAIGTGTNPPLFAAGFVAAGGFSGAWRSDDGGTTWEEIDEGLERDQTQPVQMVNVLLVHPRKRGLLWAGGNGVFRSLDDGAHWARTSAGLACGVTSLAIDSQGILYAGCLIDPVTPPPLPPDLFVSFDLGLTWHAAVRGLAAGGVTALAADPSGTVWAGTQRAGVFRTANGGRRWGPAGTGTEGQTITALAQAPRQASLLLAGSGFFLSGVIPQDGPGIFRTTSTGARWALSSSGLDATSIISVAADPVVSGLLTVADFWTGGGVFRTRSGGAHWRSLDGGLPPAPSIAQIEGDTVRSGELYAAGTVNDAFVFYQHSPDAAAPWQRLTSVPATCFGPLTAGARGQLFLGAFGDGGGVCASQDAGATWIVSGVGFIGVGSIAIAPSNPSRVYASGQIAPHAPPGPTFYRSDDGGATWTGVGAMATSTPHGLAVDPLDENVVYVAAIDGIERSRDGGVTWENILPGAPTLVRVDPRAPNTVYAATGYSSAYYIPPPQEPQVSVSEDGGATWTPLTQGLAPNVAVVDLAFDAANPALLYAATAGGGVFSLQRVH